MNTINENLQPDQRIVLDRLITACQKDDRVLAATLEGSYAKGTFDQFSDLDIALITSDDAFEEFCANRYTFMHQLGEPVSMENFEVPYLVCFVLDNGVEGDLHIHRESQLDTYRFGPFLVLLDKRGILKDVKGTEYQPEPDVSTEKLRQMIYYFWHDWMHFTTALGRGQLWWAQGQLETLRGYCVSLFRFTNDFYDPEAGKEHYFKIEQSVQPEQLLPLKTTFGPLEKDHLYQAGLSIVQIYRDLAHPLAQEHGMAYPEALDALLMKRFEEIRQ